MKLAIATYKDEIAPCFEAAKRFQVCSIERSEVISKELLNCNRSGPIARLRLLKDAAVEVLLCNGIRSFYKDMLEAENLMVYKDLTGRTDEILVLFMSGKIKHSGKAEEKKEAPCLFELGELVEMTREYLTRNGFVIERDESDFPVDMIATLKCPRCKKPIRVAVCCAGHVFYWEKEIMELRSISENYDAAVYVHAAQDQVVKTCKDFNINLLDPWVLENPEIEKGKDSLPFFKIPVKGHEAVFAKR
ncbi:MAG: hypothetical protein GWN61_18320 [candidate division Zixibacteria bacterium]|nr:hypothetical protein [candidate division Zixibacteria bacterium]NIR66202.1 hypothetical protein [candidate division Zixibacteria bacterium]NIS47824.1 hypothetical protein [candidate division Zixibacteria bacterium]NIU15924.1 hypothetical protein [candidate division Zixibacteria bacterium]NIV08076.1 hypothetical protein [candidate division Zixibacteria bacterium]